MKHLRQYIRHLLTESSYQTVRLHHSRGEERNGDKINFGPYPQPTAADQIGPKKPNGIWYDCDNEWEDFCINDLGSYNNRGYDAVYEVFPNPNTVATVGFQGRAKVPSVETVRRPCGAISGLSWTKVHVYLTIL